MLQSTLVSRSTKLLWPRDVYDYRTSTVFLIVIVKISLSLQTSALLLQQNVLQEQHGQQDSRQQQL